MGLCILQIGEMFFVNSGDQRSKMLVDYLICPMEVYLQGAMCSGDVMQLPTYLSAIKKS